MSDLIGRQEMLNRLEEWNTDDPTDKALYNFAWNRIIEQPTIEPEIVRCKDCKFYSPMNKETKTGICNLTMHQNFGDDWFCAGAERRTDE